MRIAQQKKRGMPHVRLIMLSFAAIIAVGAFLLMLPISSNSGSFTPPEDALFTATSATCVTGLVVFDTFAHWNGFGQAIILLLIQLGGLGLISFTTFFTLTIRRKLGIRDLQLANEYISNGSLKDVPRLLRLVVAVSFTVECLGALLLSFRFVPAYGDVGVWISIFLAVSAYCNAGFDILGREGPFSSLTNYNDDPLVLLTISALIIIGGLGFIVFNDILSYRRGHSLLLHTRVVLIFSTALIVIGALLFFLIEYNNSDTMKDLPLGQKILASFFQSVSARTAGFNSVDVGAMYDPSKMLMCALMFIGAASGSTGGGIKITTFIVLVMTVVSVVRGREDTIVLGRKVSKRVVYRALAIAAISGLIVIVAFFVIVYCQQEQEIASIDALFEAVSAFGTVGLSTGVTPDMTLGSKFILIVTMFAGRVGPVSLALALTVRDQKHESEVLPEGRILVG